MKNFKKFQSFITEKGFKSFTFLSENQPSYSAVAPCKLQLTFTNILIGDHPRVIFLTDGKNHMMLTRIKDVRYGEGDTAIGSLIHIYCGDSLDDHSTVQYSLIAS